MNLLTGETPPADAAPEVTEQMNAITKAVKRGIEPVMAELKQVKKQVIMTTQNKCLTSIFFRMLIWIRGLCLS